MRPITIRVTTASPLAVVRLDQFHGAALAVAAVIEDGPTASSAAYAIDYTFEDPNDLVNPVALASLDWDASLVPVAAQQGLTSLTFVIPTAPVWGRVQLLSGSTKVRVTFTQYEAHRAAMVTSMPPSQMLQTAQS
jgi:hypothetical protein